MLEKAWFATKKFAYDVLDGSILTNIINRFIASHALGSSLLVTTLSPTEIREQIEKYTNLKEHQHYPNSSIFAFIRKHYKGIALNENEFHIKVNDAPQDSVYRMKIKLISKEDGTLVLLHFPEATNKLLLIFLPIFMCYFLILGSDIELPALLHFIAWIGLFYTLFKNWSHKEDKKIGTNFWKSVLYARQVSVENIVKFSSSDIINRL